MNVDGLRAVLNDVLTYPSNALEPTWQSSARLALSESQSSPNNDDKLRTALTENLCMLVARMARRLRKHKEHVEDHKLAEQAEGFLRANGRLGSILREANGPRPL